MQELCQSRGGRLGFLVPDSFHGFCGGKSTFEEKNRSSEFKGCVKVEVAVLGSLSLIVFMVSVDVNQHLKKKINLLSSRAVSKSRWPSWAPRARP